MSLKSKKKKTAVSPLVRGSAAAGAAAQARAKKSTPKKQKQKQTVQPAKAAMSKAPVAKKKTTATSASGRNDAAVRQSYGQRAGTRTSSGAYKPTQSAAYNYKKAETKRSTISTDIKNQTKVKTQKPSVVSGPVHESRYNRDKRMRQSWSQRHPENQVQREQRKEEQRPKSYVPTKGMAIPNKGQSAYDAEIEDFTRKNVQAGKLNPNERAGIAQGPMKDKGPIDLSTARDYDTMLSGGTVSGKYIPDENKVGALEYNIRMMGQDALSKPYAEEIFKNASPSEQAQLVKAARETVGFNEQTDRWAKEADKARANASAEEQGRVNDAISGTRRDQYGQVVNSREKLQDYIYRTSTDKYNSAVKQQQFVDQWAKEHGTTAEDYLRSRFNTGAGGFVQSVWDGLFLPAESVKDYDRPGYYLGGFKAPHEGISKDKNILQNSWQWYTNLTSDAITMALLPYKALFKNTAERSDNFRQGSQNLYDLAMKWTGQDERIVRQEALRRLNESMGKDQNPATQFVGDALEATVQMVPGMALSVVNPAVGMALFAESAGGMYARSALDNGASLEEALTYGTMCGALEGAVEKIFPFMGTYGRSFSGGMLAKMLGGRTTRGKVLFDSVVRDLSSNAFRQSMRGRILIGLGESLGEFTEEALMEVIEPFVRKSTYDAMADYASLEEIGMAGLLGAAIGVGLHAPSIGAATTGTLAKSVYISNQKLFAKAEYEDAVTRATNMADMGIISKELAERSIKEAKAIYDRNMAELAGVSGTGSLLDEERQGGEYKTSSSNLEHIYSNRKEANAATVEPGTSAYFMEDGEVKRITHSEAGVKSEDAVLTNSEKTAYAEKAERLRSATNNTERTGVQANVRQDIIDQAAEMARVYNRNVEFYRDEEAAKRYDDRGRFDPKTETIYVNAATDKPLQTIISHEMVHAMRNTNAFKELLQEIKTYYKDSYDADVNDIRRMYSERDENGNVIEPSEGIIQEEVVAHFVEKKLLTDEAWVNTFLTNSRTDKILRGINTLLQRGLGGKEARFLASVRSKWLNALEEERGEQTAPRAEAVAAAKEMRSARGKYSRNHQPTNVEERTPETYEGIWLDYVEYKKLMEVFVNEVYKLREEGYVPSVINVYMGGYTYNCRVDDADSGTFTVLDKQISLDKDIEILENEEEKANGGNRAAKGNRERSREKGWTNRQLESRDSGRTGYRGTSAGYVRLDEETEDFNLRSGTRQVKRTWETQQDVSGDGSSKIRRAFGGVRARTADTSLQAKAKEMKEEGRSDEDILKETGWYVGADGQWRFEIDDSELIFDKRGLARNPDEARLKELENKMIFGSLSEEEAAEARELAQVVKDMRKPSKLSDYVKHDKLFAAYPELEDVTLKMMRPEDIERARGGYDDDNNVIYLNRTLSEDERRETLIHEIQHAIQDIEGFASGASPEYWSRRDSDAREDLARRQNSIIESLSDEDYRKYSEYTGMKRIVDGWIDVAGNLPVEEVIPDDETYNIWKQTAEESDRLYEELKEKDWFDELMELDEFLENPSKLHYNLYRNTAGEIEARDATNRLPLTAEERRNKIPDRGDEKTVFVEDVRSAKGSRDSEYLSAVERGDMETASRMVREAARKAGFNSPKLFHGTNAFGFTKIDTNVPEADGFSFWASTSEATSATYTRYGKVRRISEDIRPEEIDALYDQTEAELNDAISHFRGLIDRTFSEWFFGQTDNSHIYKAVYFANPETGFGDGVYDVLMDMVADAYDQYGEELQEQYDDYLDWQEESDDFDNIEKAIIDIESIRKKIDEIDESIDGGIYELYGNTDNMFVLECNGALWNNLRPEGLPKLKTAWSDDAFYNTRSVAVWARNQGYDGVIFKDIRDNGQYGRTEPADVYAFFNPVKQVKSADPVTRDNKGEIIPLSERFNENNDDIRWAKGGRSKDSVHIKEQIKKHRKEIDAAGTIAVAEVPKRNWLDKSDSRKWINNLLKKTGYAVDRMNFGRIQFADEQINIGLNYLKTPGEIAAFAVLPKVLKRGVLIHIDPDHENRGYPTYTFAGNVEINGKPGTMAAIVMRTKGNRYKTHRILSPDNSVFVLQYRTNAEPEPDRGITQDVQSRGGVALSTRHSASDKSISKSDEKGKTRFAKGDRHRFDPDVVATNYFVGDTVEVNGQRGKVEERYYDDGDIRYVVLFDDGSRKDVLPDELTTNVTPSFHFDELPEEEQEAFEEPPNDYDFYDDDIFYEDDDGDVLYEEDRGIRMGDIVTSEDSPKTVKKRKKASEKRKKFEKPKKKDSKSILDDELIKEFLATESDGFFDTGENYDLATYLTGDGVTYSKDYARNFDAASRGNQSLRGWLQDLFVRPLEKGKRDYANAVDRKLNQMRTKMKELGIKKGSQESAAVQWYGEKFYTDEYGVQHDYTLEDLKKEFPEKWEDIKEAAEWFRKVYDDYLVQINTARAKIYPDPVGDVTEKVNDYQDKVNYYEQRIDETRAEIREIERALDTKRQDYASKKDGTKVKEKLERSIRYNERRIEKRNAQIEEDILRKQKYKNLLDRYQRDLNSGDVTRNKRIVPRKDYFHHFLELQQGLGNIFSLSRSGADIDPHLEGTSEFTQPKSKFAKITLHRKNGRYTPDAIGGMIDYIQAGEYMINIDPVISLLRSHIKGIMDATVEERNANHLIKWLVNWTNDLAGKTNTIDRFVMNRIGRDRIAFIKRLNSRAKANAVVGNLNSAFAQFFNFPNVAGYVHNPIAYAQGFEDLIKFIARQKDARMLVKESGFLNERYLDDAIRQFDERIIDKPEKLAVWTLTVGDRYTTVLIWFTAYHDGLKKNVDDPIEYADDITRRSVAGRGIGEIPLTQKSLMTQLLAPFQIEVNNAWQLYKEKVKGIAKNETKKEKAEAAYGFASVLVMNFLLNTVTDLLIHRRVVFDPLFVFFEWLGSLGDDDDDEDETKFDKFTQLLGREIGEVFSSMPFGSLIAYYAIENDYLREQLFGDNDPTRYGVGNAALKPLASLLVDVLQGKDISDDVLTVLMTYLPPVGGKQIERFLTGLKMEGYLPDIKFSLKEGFSAEKHPAASYNAKGELQFPIEDFKSNPLQALVGLVFGKYATDAGQKYLGKDYDQSWWRNILGWNNIKPGSAMNERATSVFNALVAEGSDRFAIFDVLNELKGDKKISVKRDILLNSGLTDGEMAAILLNVITDKDKVESETNKLNSIIGTGAFNVSDYLKIKNIQSKINADKNMSAEDKALLFVEMLQGEGYSDSDVGIITEVLKFWKNIPANTKRYDTLTTTYGLDSDTAAKVTKAINQLTPLEGASEVSEMQKFEAIAGLGLDDETETRALRTAFSDEKSYAKYVLAHNSGVSPQLYADFKKALKDANDNNPDESKRNTSYDNEEKQTALDSLSGATTAQKAALWQIADNALSKTDHDAAWKGARNPYDTSVGTTVADGYTSTLESVQSMKADTAELSAERTERDKYNHLKPIAAKAAALGKKIVKNLSKDKTTAETEEAEEEGAFGQPITEFTRVSSPFGYNVDSVHANRLHAGMDLAAPEGTPAMAVNGGTVTYAGQKGGYGNCVMYKDADGVEWLYGHLATINVSVGDTVTKGQKVGGVDSTGNSTGNHLHFEARVNGNPVNPQSLIDVTGGGLVTADTGVKYSGGGGGGGRKSGGKKSGGSSGGKKGKATTQAAYTPSYAPTTTRYSGSSGSSSGGSSGKSSSKATRTPAARRTQTSVAKGIMLPTAREIDSAKRTSTPTVARNGGKSASRGIVLPTAAEVASAAAGARIGYGSGTSSIRRTNRSRGSFWHENVLG